MDHMSKSSKGVARSKAASMAALAAAAAAGDSSSGPADGAPPPPPPHGEEYSVPAKMAAVGDASSSSPVERAKPT